MWKLFVDVEMPLVETLYDMEQCGVRVEADELKAYGEKLGVQDPLNWNRKYMKRQDEIFNINSPKQLGVILFEKMGLTGRKEDKDRIFDSGRCIGKAGTGVSDCGEDSGIPSDGKTQVDLCGWIGWFYSGRWKDPWEVPSDYYSDRDVSAAQNLICRIFRFSMELGRLIRKVFIPEDGFVFVDADYSQIELRILAHCSGDDMLINAYRQAAGYSQNYGFAGISHVPFDEVTDRCREEMPRRLILESCMASVLLG